MLARWSRLVHRRGWWVLVVAVVLAASAGLASIGLASKLDQGGYEVPGSESARAAEFVRQTSSAPQPDVIVTYTLPAGKAGQAVTSKIRTTIDGLPRQDVGRSVGWWVAPTLISDDRRTAAVVIELASRDQGEQQTQWKAIEDTLRKTPAGVTAGFTGTAPVGAALNAQSQDDLTRAELVSFPILLILLVLVFGGVVAAALPLVAGGVAIVAALGVLAAINELTSVSIFAMNVVTLLGLGLAIDYGLFIVSRFREELAGPGATVEKALETTLRTSGRTVLVSALTVVAALSGLLVFPLGMLRSVGIGGMAAVVVSAVSALTVLPALLAILGRRVDALRLSLPGRRRTRDDRPDAEAGWGRVAAVVMRRPALTAVIVIGLLVVVGLPFMNLRVAATDASVLPAHNVTRQATERLRTTLPAASGDSVEIMLIGERVDAPVPAPAVVAILKDAGNTPGLHKATPVGAKNGRVLIRVDISGDPQSVEARDAVRHVRELPAPAGVREVLVGGTTAKLIDTIGGVTDQVPWMIAVLAGAILVLLFLAFGSVLVPIKAVLLSALSLTASFGAMVWIFSDGHLISLFNTEAAPIDVILPVLMLAVLFGLSTDYEVFLLSRIAEGYRSGLEPKAAVIYGLRRTGGIITAAAILLMVVIGAFALSDLRLMKILGAGMLIAIAVDATIVRGLLVPSILALLGRAAWWAPGPLARLQRRLALEGEHPRTTERSG